MDAVFLTFCQKLMELEFCVCKVNIFKDYIKELYLKGHGNEAYFRGFCINRFGIGPLHYMSNRSDFGFEYLREFEAKIGTARKVRV